MKFWIMQLPVLEATVSVISIKKGHEQSITLVASV